MRKIYTNMPTISYHKTLFLLLVLSLYGIRGMHAQPLKDVRICIDAGHGGHDPSNDRRVPLAHGLIYWESEGNLTTAVHLQRILEGLGAKVRMTRTKNDDSDDISLASRSAIANAFGADYFHSIHTNAGGGNYSLVLYKEVNGTAAWPDAIAMGNIMSPRLENLLKTTGHYNRGDQSFLGFHLGVLRNTDMPATLSEGAFHDIPAEGLRLKNSKYLENYAWAIAQSFCQYFDAPCFTTGRVGGIATDKSTHKTINNVHVVATPSGSSYTGDDGYNGFYALGDLAPGTYTLEFTRSGYLPLTRRVSIVKDRYKDMDIELIPSNNGQPFADFKITGLPAGALDSLTFDASASADDGGITHYAWEYGDGATDTGRIVRYAYPQDGHYTVTLTVTDDEGNTSSLSKALDIQTGVPGAPTLVAIQWNASGDSIQVHWKAASGLAAAGFHLQYAPATDPSHFVDLAGDTTLRKGSNHAMISAGNLLPNTLYFLRLVAVNRGGKAGAPGDTYSLFRSGWRDPKPVLIIDGFDRRASYPEPTHTFNTTYSKALVHNTLAIDISSAANEAIERGQVELGRYEMVIWMLGDESTKDETFSAKEQKAVSTYLKAGGKLFITGSEIAWDLDQKGSTTDKNFYHNYFKAKFVSDGDESLTIARGKSSTFWAGQTLHFGVVYPEDYPDVLDTYRGSKPILTYNDGSLAGVSFAGKISGGTTYKLVNIGFPLETVKRTKETEMFIRGVLQFFDIPLVLSSARTPQNPGAIPIIIGPSPFGEQLMMTNKSGVVVRLKIRAVTLRGEPLCRRSIALPPSAKYRLNTAKWPKGVVLFRIEMPHGAIKTYKLVKQ